MAKVVQGECRLCHRSRRLVKSHLLAAGFYALIDDGPVVITPEVARPSSKQTTAHLLCEECEDLFNKRGERYSIDMCYRGQGGFKLEEALFHATPVEQDEQFAMYDGRAVPEVDCEKLTYFGASVFWRGSANSWRVSFRTRTWSHLGAKYEEQLRRFLLDEAPWPESVTMLLFVGRAVQFPALVSPYGGRQDGFHMHRFEVPGLQYLLHVGKRIPERHKRICLQRTGRLFLTDLTDGAAFREGARLVASAPQSRKLAGQN